MTATMQKPDAARLERSVYPFFHRFEPRFADMDSLGHLNNVRLGEIYEEARVLFLRSALSESRREETTGMAFVVAGIQFSFLAEGHYPHALEVGGGVSAVGTSSLTLGMALFQQGRCIGTNDVVIVAVRRGDHGKLVIPASLRERLEARRLVLPG